MDYLLVVLGFLGVILGITGSIIPGLPGPPISYLSLLLIHWTRFAQYSLNFLLIFAFIVVVVSILDYIVPIWGTKKFGGTRAGVRGSTVGLIIGVILLPLMGIVIGPFGLIGILGGPFLGAWIAERAAGQKPDKALRAAFGSFIGFLAGTLMKLAVSFVIGFYFIKSLVQYIF